MKRKNYTEFFKKLLLIIAVFSFLLEAKAQVSGVKNIPGDYASIEAAIQHMNTNGIGAGGVTVNVLAGYVENISSTLSLTATGTSSDRIIFRKTGTGANPRINAYTGGTGVPGSKNMDGIWRLVGCDYVTIDGIDVAENAANTTSPSTMEYGYGLYKKSGADGCQHVTIQNCNITLSANNNEFSTTSIPHEGSTGICMVNAMPSVSTIPVPSARKGTNSYNAFYNNTIEQCNTGIFLSGYIDVAPYLLTDTLNDVGGTSAATGNKIFNFGGGSGSVNAATGIRVLSQAGFNVAYNIINNNNGLGVNHSKSLYGIFVDEVKGIYGSCSYNQVSLKSSAPAGNVAGIMVASVIDQQELPSSLFNISHNIIENCENLQVVFSGEMSGINAEGLFRELRIEHNIVRNISLGGSAADLYGIRTNGRDAYVIENADKNIVSHNEVSGLSTSGTGNLCGIYSRTRVQEEISNNTIYNLQHHSTAAGFFKISGIISTGEYFDYIKNKIDISGNVIHDLLMPAGILSDEGITGISVTDRSGIVSGNSIYNFSGQATKVTGVLISMKKGMFYFSPSLIAQQMQISRNKLYDLSSSASVTVVSGIVFTNDISNFFEKKSTSCIIDNNVIGRFFAPSAISDNTIRGIEIDQLTIGDAKVYYNTISLNAVSGGADFGSSGIYTIKAAPNMFTGVTGGPIEMKNNLVSNVSFAAGNGLTVAYRKSGVAWGGTDHLPSSDNNLFYAGVPDTAHLLLYDETNAASSIADLKALLAPAEASYSFSSKVDFADTNGISPNFLVPDLSIPTQIESGAANIDGFETDMNGNIRAGNTGYTGTALMPDMGAYERGMTLLDISGPVIIHHSPELISSGMPTILHAEIKDLSGVNTSMNIPAVYFKKGLGGSYVISSGTLESGNAMKGKWSFTIDPLNLGGVTPGDSVYYFIAAQDVSMYNYLSSLPTGATGTVNSITGYPSSPLVLLVTQAKSGNYLIGSSQLPPNYTTITEALNDLKKNVVTGNINLLLQADYQSIDEPAFPIVFTPFKRSNDAYTVTLKPDVNVNAVVQGETMPDDAIFKFDDDAANYIIDGSNNNTGSRNLVIRNTQQVASKVVWFNGSATEKGTRDIQLKNTVIEAGSEDQWVMGIGIGGDFRAFTGATHERLLISNNLIQNCWMGIMQMGSYTANTPANGIMIIEKNTIQSFSPDNSQMQAGIFLENIDKIRIDQNRILNAERGIVNVGTMTNSTISNNVISNIYQTAIDFIQQGEIYNDSVINNVISEAHQIGILLPQVAEDVKLYYNTVLMKKDGHETVAIYIPTPGVRTDIRNNIFSCHIPMEGAPSAALLMDDISNMPSIFDHNAFFVDNMSLIALDNMTMARVSTLSDFQTRTNSNFNSLHTDPLFNGPDNAILLPNSPLIGKAVSIPGLTRDLKGDLRSATVPTIGAYETAVDASGPAFTYAPITDTSIVTSRKIFVSIKDFSGIDVSANRPRIYYKKSTDTDTFGVNNGSFNGWKWVAASNTSSPFEFTIDHSLLNGGSVITGDIIQYFFVASDLIGNIGASHKKGLSGTVNAIVSAPVDPGVYNIVGTPMNGSYTVGTGGIYPDLTAAVSDIRSRGLSGNVSLEIVSNITEPGSVVFKEWKEFGAGNYTLSVIPSASNPAGDTIMASASDGAVLMIDGADRMIIDGRLNNAGNYLTFINHAVAPFSFQAAVWVKGPNATDNTIRNINAITQNSVNGVAINVSEAANDRLRIQDNVLMKAGYGIRVISNNIFASDQTLQLVVSGNKIGSDSASGYITTRGISLIAVPGAEISGNDVFNIVNNVWEGAKGIEVLNSKGAVLKNNRIKNISSAYSRSDEGGASAGIDVSGDSIMISNNEIAGIFNVQTKSEIRYGSCGIMVSFGNGHSIIHNSVNIYGLPVPGGNTNNRISSALAFTNTSSGATVENNILANRATGTGNISSYCIYAPRVSFASVDHNNYDTTGAGNGGYVGYGGVPRRSLTEWKVFSRQDSHSVCVTSGFTTMNDLMIATAGTLNALESGGKTIAAVTTDRSGKSRPYTTPTSYGGNTAPDMGAYEFDGANGDGIAPVITLLNPPKRSSSLAAQTIEATITDARSGVSTSFIPRLYFKKRSDANVWISNAPGDNGWKWVEASNNFSPFSFNISYSLLFNGSVSNMDTIQYFIVAQDQSPRPNIGSSASNGFSATSVDTILSFPVDPASYIINTSSPLNGIYDVGVSGVYPTITSALSDLDLRGISGAVTFRLTDAAYNANETFPLRIGEIINASATNTVTIKPATGVKPVISGSASEIFRINADASFLVIDGSNDNTLSRDLSVVNNSTSGASMVLMIEGQKVTVKNTVIKGGSPMNEAGIKIAGGKGLNQSVSILNNQIYHVNAGIKSVGVNVGELLIEDNTIGTDSTAFFIREHGMNIVNAQRALINRNRIYNIKTADPGVTSTGINVMPDVVSATISNNTITGVHAEAGQSSATASGIAVGGNRNSVDSLYNNMVSDIMTSNDNSTSAGIFINNAGSRMVLYHNTVHLSGQSAIGNGVSSSAALLVTYISGTPQIEFRNNIFSNVMTGIRGGSVHGAIQIDYGNEHLFTSDYNNFYASGAHGMMLTVSNYVSEHYNTFADLKRVLGTDVNSRNEEVHFVSSTDLHLVAPSNGNTALAGRPVVRVVNDIDNTPRSTSYPYMGADEASVPVPVKMVKFDAQLAGNDVMVNWSTASEINNKGFTIERSADNVSFEAIGYVRGKGNSAVINTYNHRDVNAFESNHVNTLYYRLRQQDMNGDESVSAVVSVHRNERKQAFAISVYPNPVADVVTVALSQNITADIEITDLMGRVVKTAKITNMEIKIDVASLDAGIYLVKIKGSNTEVMKLVKQQ